MRNNDNQPACRNSTPASCFTLSSGKGNIDLPLPLPPTSRRDKARRKGQLGGLVTYLRHGSEYYSRIGRMGGRPKQRTLNQLRQQAGSGEINKKGDCGYTNGDFSKLSLTNLRGLFRLRRAESSLASKNITEEVQLEKTEDTKRGRGLRLASPLHNY